MEITIDVALVRAILAEEAERARAELRSVGPLRALGASQSRHDARIAAAPDVGTLACREGCTWCCHFSVDVRAVEAFRILEFIERELDAATRARIEESIRVNSATLRHLDEMERMRHNVRCAFLDEGRCLIYPVRPQTCRNYHATDAAGCRQSYEDPDNLDIDPEFAPYVYQAGTAHVDGFSRALRAEGFDDRVYELHAALEAALDNPAAQVRFAAKAEPFPTLCGREVPEEFADLDED